MKESYRIDELAEAWETKPKVLRLMIATGKLQGFKVGSQWRVKHSERVRYENNCPLEPSVYLYDPKMLKS